MTKNPTISVVTPSYNQEQYLEDAITSVISQTGVDLEYFVFDGGSSDGSVEIIKRHSKCISHWVSQKDRGQSDAINQGLGAAKGEILCWINSDDYLKAGALEVVSNFFRENPEIDWVVGGCELINDQEDPHDIVWPPEEITMDGLMNWWPDHWFCQQATFWRRSLMDRAGLLDESLHYLMDWELWLRFFAISRPAVLKHVLAGYRFHSAAKCVAANGPLTLEELMIHEKIQFGSDEGCLAKFKNVSAKKLIALARNAIINRPTAKDFPGRVLVREAGRRLMRRVSKGLTQG